MTRLILEEGGERREFRVGDGVLTVGTGETAKLRLASPDAAEVHLELDVTGAEARVRPRPGVVAPRLDGVPLSGEGTLAPGHALSVGGAVIRLEADESELGPIGARLPSSGEKRPLRPRHQPKSRSVVQRTRPRVKRGLPSGLVIALPLIVVGVVVAFLAKVFRDQGELGAGPVWASIQAAEEQFEAGNFDLAEVKLAAIPEGRETTLEERERIASLRAEISERRRATEEIRLNMRGSKYLDVMLKKYEAKWLSGSPEPHEVRLFLQRCREFRRRWPTHPDMEWVARQESRFEGFVDLSAEPTWKDIEWEIRYVAGQKPRNYALAFEMLDDFMRKAEGEELLEAEELRQKLIGERIEYHEDRMQQARYEYDRMGDSAQSVWWLIHSVIWIGDEEMADEAAGYLVKIPRLEEHLAGYRETYPDRYEAVLAHRLVREFAVEKGLPLDAG